MIDQLIYSLLFIAIGIWLIFKRRPEYKGKDMRRLDHMEDAHNSEYIVYIILSFIGGGVFLIDYIIKLLNT